MGRYLKKSAMVLACLVAAAVALTLLAYSLLQPPPALALPERGAVLKSVILAVPGESHSAPVDLQVTGNRITAITPSRHSAIAGYVVPGLADAHMHSPPLPMPGEEEIYAFLHLYHGITGARMAAGNLNMRNAISSGLYPGPRLLSCGPFVDGEPPLWPNSKIVTDDNTAALVVGEIFEQGYDCIKVYNELTAEASQSVYAAASERGLRVIGHVPWRQDAAKAWIDDQQHLLGIPSPTTIDPHGQHVRAMQGIVTVDDERLQGLATAMRGRGTALTPTLVTLQRKIALERYTELQSEKSSLMLPRYYRKHLWHGTKGLVSSRLFTAEDYAKFRAAYPVAEQAIRTLHAAGVEIHSGTDAPAEFIVPGAGLLDELALLKGAGLSDGEVVKISSVTTYRYLFGETYGTLEVGSPADFVIYAHDPGSDLANLNSRTGVVADGRYYSRESLENQLALYQVWYEDPVYRAVSESIVGAVLWLINSLS